MNLISKRTQKLRREEMTKAGDILSAGSPSIVLLATEMRSLAQEERDELLKTAGITVEMKPEQGLALKAGLGILLNKLRLLRRYVMCTVCTVCHFYQDSLNNTQKSISTVVRLFQLLILHPPCN